MTHRPAPLHALPLKSIAVAAGCSLLMACNPTGGSGPLPPSESASELSSSLQNNALLYSDDCITESEVVDAQIAWSDSIIRIGKLHKEAGDYRQAAKDHIQTFYGYDLGSVLFKPTLAAQKQFRNSFDAALSYFVGGNESYPEDKGFAIKGWTKIRWENAGIINNNCKVAVAMGNYYFTPPDDSADVKVEYTFAYVKDRNNHVKIAVHQSSVPFQGGN